MSEHVLEATNKVVHISRGLLLQQLKSAARPALDLEARRQATEASLKVRLKWHDEHMKRLGKIATPAVWPPENMISIEEWRRISPHRDDKPPVIEPYVPPEPASVRYGLVRPVGYRTPDAVVVDVQVPSPEYKGDLLKLLTEPVPSFRLPSGDLTPSMVCWKLAGIQSVDAMTMNDGDHLRLFVDADARHQEIKQRLEETSLEQLAKDFTERNR